MANNKNQKTVPVRLNDYQPKAGPKSNSSGRKKNSGRAANTNGPSLFDLIRNDKLEQQKLQREDMQNQREKAKQREAAKQFAFRTAQANLAKSLLGNNPGLTQYVARLIIDNFVDVTPGNGIKRTPAAELLILDQLTSEQLAHKQAVDNGRFIARQVLRSAFDLLTRDEAGTKPETMQLEMA